MNNNHATNNRIMSNVLCLSYAVLGRVSLWLQIYCPLPYYVAYTALIEPHFMKSYRIEITRSIEYPQTERGLRQVCLFTPHLFNTYGKSIPP